MSNNASLEGLATLIGEKNLIAVNALEYNVLKRKLALLNIETLTTFKRLARIWTQESTSTPQIKIRMKLLQALDETHEKELRKFFLNDKHYIELDDTPVESIPTQAHESGEISVDSTTRVFPPRGEQQTEENETTNTIRLTPNEKDLRRATLDAIPTYNDEKDINVLNKFIKSIENHFTVTKYNEAEKMIFLTTKIGTEHQEQLLEESEKGTGDFTWDDWKTWMRTREVFRNDESKALEELKRINQFKMKLTFQSLYLKMRAINRRISDYEKKEEHFQRAVIAAVDLDYREKFETAWLDEKRRKKIAAIPRDDFYEIGELYEKQMLKNRIP